MEIVQTGIIVILMVLLAGITTQNILRPTQDVKNMMLAVQILLVLIATGNRLLMADVAHLEKQLLE